MFCTMKFRNKAQAFPRAFIRLEKKAYRLFINKSCNSEKCGVNVERVVSQTVAVDGGRRLLALPPARAVIQNSSIEIPILIKINKLPSHQCPFGSDFKNCAEIYYRARREF